MTVKKWTFPGGERGVDISESSCTELGWYTIDLKFKSSDDLIDLALEVDAARRVFNAPNSGVKIMLNIEYFPYARQDRVMKYGESHSLRVIADFINSLKLDRIVTVDPHSDVVEALVNNLTIVSQCEAVRETIDYSEIKKYDYLIAPDAGALKKIYKISEWARIPVICAQKIREHGGDVKVQLSKEDFNSLKGCKVLVVDDICDGGRTFTELAKLFPYDCAPDLYVTHGIFSKGKEELLEHYGEIFCYNDMSVNKKGTK